MKRQTRLATFLTLLLLPIGGALWGQTNGPISTVRISTNPGGARFLVDGLMYTNAQVFLWPQGSKHIVEFPQDRNPDGSPAGYQSSLDGLSRFALGTWTLNNGSTPSQSTILTVIADPTLTSVTITTAASYRIQLRYSRFPVSLPGDCSPGLTPQDGVRTGLVLVGGVCYGSDADFFASAGPVNVVAYPFPGYLFGGWSTNGGPPVSYSGIVTLNGPITLVAQFIAAKRVTFKTNPLGLNLLIDRTPTPTIGLVGAPVAQGMCPSNLSLPGMAPVTLPGLCLGDFDFIPGSSHVLSAASPQYDVQGNMWVIDSFSNGAKPNDVVVISTDLSKADTITGNFVPGDQVSFLTNPNGLKLTIDGRTNWQTYTFAWGAGSNHSVSAADQTDAKGRRWVFTGWSNGGTAAQNFTVAGPIRWTANFQALPQAILQSNPSGLTLSVDGASCTTPCTLDRAAGTVVNVVTPQLIPMSDMVRLRFDSWTDGASNSRALAFDVDQRTLIANYQTQFKLLASSDPTQGATFVYDPPSPDSFFAQDSGVMLKAMPKGGYRFRRWDGDLTGTYNQGTVLMGAPRNVLALLDRIPFIAPAGIRNAAGVTPDGTIAPGSLISITGESLAPDYVAGRTNPLSQAVGNLTVTLNDRLLPLVYVSPEEIRAQMVSGLPDGDYSLTVHSAGQPDVVGQFTISQNSPGLFADPAQAPPSDGAVPNAWALHSDGSAVTPNSPAQQGEVITIYGTGFGPVDGFTLDGFPVPTDLKLKGNLQVQAGDSTLDPVWAGAVSGQAGMMSVKFTITPDLPQATTIKVSVTVNGKASNPVNLALQ